jgi:hypothetical protein
VSCLRTIAAALALLLPAHAAEDPGQLLRRLDTRTPEAREQAARVLAALGPAVLDELFALVSPAAEGERDELLARAFALQPKSELQAFFGCLAPGSLAPGRLKPALLVLREAGSARELGRCLELAGAGGGGIQAELVAALAGICAREPGACELALAAARTAAVPDAESLARGLAEARTSGAAQALVRLALQRPELASLALSCLLSEAERLPRPVEPELLALVREQLAHEDHPAGQELLLLAGRLEDDESVPLLLERLSASRPELRANALWSLQRITGLGLGPDAQAWSQWFQEESAWWRDRSRAALALLHSPEPAAQRRGLGELGQRFWRREQLAAEIGEYLESSQGDCARMACGLLARLGCASAVPLLEARLEDEDPAVQKSARSALAQLTGKKIPSRAVGVGCAPGT